MSEREEVLNEFGTAECVKRDDCTHFDCVAERKMADEIVRLRSQLAAALLVNSAALDKAERERDEARRERDGAIADRDNYLRMLKAAIDESESEALVRLIAGLP